MNNTSQDVCADRGYPSVEHEAMLIAAEWRVKIPRKYNANKLISETQKQRKSRIAMLRARVEYVFRNIGHGAEN